MVINGPNQICSTTLEFGYIDLRNITLNLKCLKEESLTLNLIGKKYYFTISFS